MSMYRSGFVVSLLLLGGLSFVTVRVEAKEDAEEVNYYVPKSLGVRGGFSSDIKAHDFDQFEGYVRWDLPWTLEWSEKWSLKTGVDLSLGYLTDNDDGSFVGTVGPVFTLGREGIPVVAELGSSPTFLSRHRFDRTDFGVFFQFTTHIGLRWNINDHLNLGYRYQHMSNAGLDEKNPGLDMHFFSMGYRF